MVKEEIAHTILNIKERNIITVNGVKNILGFDESFVTLDIGSGKICIEGVGLKIESLKPDDGEIKIIGRIDGAYYAEEKKALGVFKLFK